MAITCTEVITQEYTNMAISAGTVEGHPVDTLYFKFKRGDEDEIFLLMRPDEVSALIWCLSGALWSQQMESVPEDAPATGDGAYKAVDY